MSAETTTWRVFKYADDRTDNTWREVGAMNSKYEYGTPDVQEIGEHFGVGRFLFFKASETWNVREVEITAKSYYEEVVAEEVVAP